MLPGCVASSGGVHEDDIDATVARLLGDSASDNNVVLIIVGAGEVGELSNTGQEGDVTWMAEIDLQHLGANEKVRDIKS